MITNDEIPILSFAIPTWNRAEELEECLKNIVAEIQRSNANVEIFVSDNGSTDSTPQVLEKYSQKYNFIRYSRNEHNLGFDLNLINAIENSRGKYVWTFSDDDIIAEGSINKIIDVINKYDPSYIALNYDQCIISREKKGLCKKIKPDKITKYNYKELSLLSDNLNFKELLKKEFLRFTLLDINIFKKSFLNLNLVKANLTKIKNWSHLYMIAQATNNGGGLILPFICVHQRVDNSNAKINVFLKILPNALQFIFKEYNIEETYQVNFFKIYKKMYLSFLSILSIILRLKINREKISLDDIDERFRTGYISFSIKYIYNLIPRNFAVFIAKCYRFYIGKGFNINDKEKDIRFD